ncbi:MAG: chemotaxis response regulator protein-glutamate methylesterase [Proteobacteria bacterium]|nr:MAG: chemotaxis response regulator protein-glutamate methylesterase [Pseudomonadota bacterium]
MPGRRVKVLVVDDSTVMRQLLAATLSEDPAIEVVGTAPDPLVARDKIKELNPDVVTLDVEMPRMDGLTFLRKIMTLRPMPVVMVSTLTQAGTDTTLEALEIGAVDFVAKPNNEGGALGVLAEELRAKVKMAASTSLSTARRARAAPVVAPRPARLGRSTGKVVTIGASTGGVEALKAVLMDLPEDGPPILITQHMPEKFTTAFAARLDRECPMRVFEAAHDQRVEQGNVYIAPGSHHLELGKDGLHYICKLNDGERVSGHKPSVDVLFRSAARVAGSRIVAAILTGMGKDGAEGMLELRRANAITIGQDEASSLVYGMPRVAFERGAVQRQYPLNKIAQAIVEACCGETNARRSA